jgi:hypothetical protein
VLPLAARQAITLQTTTVTAAHADGGFVEVDATNCKGLYRLDLTDAAIASGDFTLISIEFDGIIEETIEIPLHTRAVNVTQWLGTAPATPTVAGVPEVDLTHVGGVTTNVSALATNADAIKTKTDFLPSATAGASGGVFIAGTNAATTVTTSFTTTFTGNLTGSVDSVTNAVGSVTATVTADLDTIKTQAVTCAAGVTINPSVGAATIQPTVTQFDARTLVAASYFDPAADTVANVTTVATTTNLTNLPTIPANWITTAGITDGAFTAAKFAASSLNGKGDWNTVVPDAAGTTVVLTDASSDAVIADAVWNALTATYGGVGSYGEHVESLSAGGDATEAKQDTIIANQALIPQSGGTTTWNATALASINAEADTALSDMFTSSAQLVDDIWDEDLSPAHDTAGSAGKALQDAGSAGDPWSTALPGAYGAGTAGEILGDWKNAGRLDTILDTVATATTASAIAASVWDVAQSSHVIVNSMGSIATEIASILVDTAEIGTAGVGLTNLGGSGNNWNTVVPDAAGTAPTAQEIEDEVWDALQSAHVTVDSMGAIATEIAAINTLIGALETAGDVADAVWIEPINDHKIVAGSLAEAISNIEVDTNELQTDDVPGLIAALNNVSTADLATALTDIHLDHLMATAAADVVVDGSVIAHMVSSTEDWSTFVPSDDSLQAIRDRGDASWTTGAGGSLATGTADSGTTTTMVDAALTEADTDYWKGNLIEFTNGTLDGQVRLITDFTPATDTITFYPATTQAVATHTYQIIAAADGDAKAVILAAIDALGAPVTISTASVSRLQDTTLRAYIGENVTFPPITPKDVDGTTLDTTAITLEVIIENKDKTDVVTIADAALTKTTTTVQFTSTAAANVSEARKYWSIRRTDTSVTVAKGDYVVEYAAAGDA